MITVKGQMGTKPVIAVTVLSNPIIMAELDPYADAILVNFEVSNQAALEVASGNYEPSGLLPIQMPKDMDEVEKQYEDVGLDVTVYKDSQGNEYDFAYGLDWNGVIDDWRTQKYKHTKETPTPDPDPDPDPTPGKPGNPKTGDNGLAVALTLVMAAGFVVVVSKKRRNNR